METGVQVSLRSVNFTNNRAATGPALWTHGMGDDSITEVFFGSNTLYCPPKEFSYDIGGHEEEVTKLQQ